MTGPRLADAVGTWTLDAAHSLAAFSVRHMTIARVSGRFDALDGEVVISVNPVPRAAISVRIGTASVTSGHAKRDELIRSADFLDTERFPELTFEGDVDEEAFGERWSLAGSLTVRGVPRPAVLEVTSGGIVEHRGATRAGFSATATIDRRDFGLAFGANMAGGGLVVSNEVRIHVEAELVRS